MPRLIYNGIELTYSISRVVQEPVYDESKTDVLYRKSTITVESVLTVGQSPLRYAESLTSAQRRIQHALETPRRPLLFEYNGEAMIQSTGVDSNNGPKPESVVITKLTDHALRLSFTVTVCQVNCPEKLLRTLDGVVSNRWTETVSLDDAGRTEIRRRGRIIVASNLINNPDRLRALTFLPIPLGFRRTKAHYTLKEDNTTLDYEFVDHETFLQPPAPAKKASGTFRILCDNNTDRWGEVRVELTGSTDVNKIDLMATAISVAVGKLIGRQINPSQTQDVWIASSTLEEDMYEPVVRVSMRCRLAPKTRRTDKLAAPDLSEFSPDTVLSSTRVPPDTNVQSRANLKGTADRLPGAELSPYGTANLGMVAAALRDPCGQTSFGNVFVNLSMPTDQGPQPVPIAGNPTLTGIGNESVSQLSTESGSNVQLLSDEEWDNWDWDVAEDEAAEFADEDPGVYDVFVCRKQYYQDVFDMVLPVAQKGSPPKVIRPCDPISYCLVLWKCVKTGFPPRIPDPDPPILSGWRLIGKPQIDILDPELLPDGVTKKWEYEGRYLYVIPEPEDALMVPASPPWLKDFAAGGYAGLVPTDEKILFPDFVNGATSMADVFNQPPPGEELTPAQILEDVEIGPGGNESQV